MPGGPVETRRPSSETYDALSRLAAAAPDRDLLLMRARAAEERLDTAGAEADWIRYAQAVPDPGDGQLALADFYHRRLEPQKEVAALSAVARSADPPHDRLVPAPRRRSWLAFERLFAIVGAQQLPAALAETQYRAWVARYP